MDVRRCGCACARYIRTHRSGWNLLDFVVVILNLFDPVLPDNTQVITCLRIGRCFRALRLLVRDKRVRRAFSSVVRALPKVGSTLLLGTAVFAIFAVIGTQMFKGKFYTCQDGDERSRDLGRTTDKFRNWQECEQNGGQMLRNPTHFDNFFASISSLVEIATMDRWVSILDNALDAPYSPGLLPSAMRQPWNAWFFVLFIFVFSLLVINLLICVIIESYLELTEHSTSLGRALSDTELALIRETKPRKRWKDPEGPVRKTASSPARCSGLFVALGCNVSCSMLRRAAACCASGAQAAFRGLPTPGL
jgi:hypothetical protein